MPPKEASPLSESAAPRALARRSSQEGEHRRPTVKWMDPENQTANEEPPEGGRRRPPSAFTRRASRRRIQQLPASSSDRSLRQRRHPGRLACAKGGGPGHVQARRVRCQRGPSVSHRRAPPMAVWPPSWQNLGTVKGGELQPRPASGEPGPGRGSKADRYSSRSNRRSRHDDRPAGRPHCSVLPGGECVNHQSYYVRERDRVHGALQTWPSSGRCAARHRLMRDSTWSRPMAGTGSTPRPWRRSSSPPRTRSPRSAGAPGRRRRPRPRGLYCPGQRGRAARSEPRRRCKRLIDRGDVGPDVLVQA